MIVELLRELRANEDESGIITQGAISALDWQRLIDAKMVEPRYKTWKYSKIGERYFWDTVDHKEYQATQRRQKHNFKGRLDWVISIEGSKAMRAADRDLDPSVPSDPQPGEIADPAAYADALAKGTITELTVEPEPKTKSIWFRSAPGAAEVIEENLDNLDGIVEVKKILRDHWEVRVDNLGAASEAITQVLLSKGKRLGIHHATKKALKKLKVAIDNVHAASLD